MLLQSVQTRKDRTQLKRAAQLVIPDEICLAEGAREQGSFWRLTWEESVFFVQSRTEHGLWTR